LIVREVCPPLHLRDTAGKKIWTQMHRSTVRGVDLCWIKDINTDRISVTYVERDGSEKKVEATVGQDLLSLAHNNDIDLEGGRASR